MNKSYICEIINTLYCSLEMLSTASQALASITVIFLAIWTTAMILGHIQNNGLNPLNYAVSEYGVVNGSKIYIAICWWCAAICGTSLCIALAVLFNNYNVNMDGSIAAVVICLAIYGPARILTWMFPCKLHRPPEIVVGPAAGTAQPDNPGNINAENHGFNFSALFKANQNQQDINNTLHFLFAIISFSSVAVAACNIGDAGSKLPETSALNRDGPSLTKVGYAIVASLVLSIFLRRRNLFGLGERIFYALQMLWFGWTAALTIVDSS